MGQLFKIADIFLAAIILGLGFHIGWLAVNGVGRVYFWLVRWVLTIRGYRNAQN